MRKIWIAALITFILVFLMGFSAALADGAAPDLNPYIVDKNGAPVGSTEQFLVVLSKPESAEYTTYDKVCEISGTVKENVNLSDIHVVLLKKDEGTGLYHPYKTTEGDAEWDIGNFGLFSRNVPLTEGMNYFVLAFYSKSDVNSLVPGETLQLYFFSVAKDKRSVLNSILKYPKKLIDVFKDIF